MNENIKDLLKETIKEELKNLSCLPSGSEEKTRAIESLVKLYKLRIEETKNEYDARDFKEKLKEEYFKLGVEAASIILPLIFYATWLRRGFKFEETGTFTSSTFRGLLNRAFKK